MKARRWLAEGVGTALLVAAIVGSGIMAEQLAGGNRAIALLGNTIPTGAILVVLVTIFGPISGAHLNPAVTLACALRRWISWRDVAPYILAQCGGGIIGIAAAHLMFDLAPFALGVRPRTGAGQWFAEAVATFALVLAVCGGLQHAPQTVPWLVGLTVTSAYWFTSSTSFANPAVTLARSFTPTFAGIALDSVAGFVVAQLAGMMAAVLLARSLWPSRRKKTCALQTAYSSVPQPRPEPESPQPRSRASAAPR